MDQDRYPDLGPKLTADDFLDAMRKVHNIWPRAVAEGSTGYERTWWIDDKLVAHHWPQRKRAPEPLWLRIRSG
ncbi:hypothetical protein GCM10019059_42410 [Camelimonas fluminis]|nr:hypothetical protein GCM10019059_42410 [Camelimonas fluminis]